jgi:hypothetical protein
MFCCMYIIFRGIKTKKKKSVSVTFSLLLTGTRCTTCEGRSDKINTRQTSMSPLMEYKYFLTRTFS